MGICWIWYLQIRNPEKFARAIVEATTHYEDYELIASLSKGLGNAMKVSKFQRYYQNNACKSVDGN